MVGTTDKRLSFHETGNWKARDDSWEEAVLTWQEQVAAAFERRRTCRPPSAEPRDKFTGNTGGGL